MDGRLCDHGELFGEGGAKLRLRPAADTQPRLEVPTMWKLALVGV